MSTQNNINEIAKVIQKAMTAQEAASRGLVPQSGNTDKPGRWIKDPKASPEQAASSATERRAIKEAGNAEFRARDKMYKNPDSKESQNAYKNAVSVLARKDPSRVRMLARNTAERNRKYGQKESYADKVLMSTAVKLATAKESKRRYYTSRTAGEIAQALPKTEESYNDLNAKYKASTKALKAANKNPKSNPADRAELRVERKNLKDAQDIIASRLFEQATKDGNRKEVVKWIKALGGDGFTY